LIRLDHHLDVEINMNPAMIAPHVNAAAITKLVV
jgi:hypothetical protein